MPIFYAEKIVNLNVNQNVTHAARMNVIIATLMGPNAMKIVKMQKILLVSNVEQSAKMIKFNVKTVVMH